MPGDLHVMKARCRCLASVGLGAPSCAKGEPNRDTLLEVRHQLLIERHYADTRRPFADIRQHGSASWRPELALRRAALRQRAGFLQQLNQIGFSMRRNRPYVQTGIRTTRRTIRSEQSAQTDAQTILVQR